MLHFRSREVNRRRAAELMRQDKPDQARIYLQRCINITHDMALALMRECRSRNIDCITAPYEADAQLAYLNIHNIAHIVITEDSDLLLFGCTRVRSFYSNIIPLSFLFEIGISFSRYQKLKQ